MNFKTVILGTTLVSTVFFTGCTTMPSYTTDIGDAKRPGPTSMGVDRQDYVRAADETIQSMLNSRLLQKMVTKANGGRLVVMLGKFKNDTTQNVDISRLTKKVRIALLNSGDFVITTAVGGSGAEDTMTDEIRKLRNDKEFNQANMAGEGRKILPDYSFAGKLIEQTSKRADGNMQADYVFQLTMTDIKNGLAIWEGESYIGKTGSNDSVSW